MTVARNGPDPDTDWFVTRSTYDIQGNLIAITDALGRDGVPATATTWPSAAGGWTASTPAAATRSSTRSAPRSRAATARARSPWAPSTCCTGRSGCGRATTPPGRSRCGSASSTATAATPTSRPPNATRRGPTNLLGRPVAHYDEAGLVTVSDVDFKGNVLQTARRSIADAPILAIYRPGGRRTAGGSQPFQVDWQPAAGQTHAERAAELLEPTAYETTTSFDALNRIVRQCPAARRRRPRRQLRPAYNRAGALEQVRLDDTALRRAHRLRRQGPAHADRLRQRRA